VEVARYYGERIGEQYHAVISWVSEMGAFARMDDTQAEGLIHLRDLGDEWFDFDGRQLALVGSVSGRAVRPGNRVIVEVVSANPARGHLDLALVTSPRALH
ncbi:S1 RNA-binding domain-containing protein, partial [Enorma massiliensis]